MSSCRSPLRIAASKVAALCGMNPYVRQDAVMCDVWCREHGYVPKTTEATLKRSGIAHAAKDTGVKHAAAALVQTVPASSVATKAKRVLSASTACQRRDATAELFQDLVRRNAARPCATSTSRTISITTVEPKDEFLSLLQRENDKDGDADDKNDVKMNKEVADKEARLLIEMINASSSPAVRDAMRKEVHTRRGCAQEISILDETESRLQVHIVDRNAKTASIEVCGGGMIIQGRVDGVVKNAADVQTLSNLVTNAPECAGPSIWIVEAKQRQNRLFKYVPIYERVQCEVYMRMHNADGCIHVQRHDGMLKTTLLTRDDQLWCTITDKCTEFLANYAVFCAVDRHGIETYVDKMSMMPASRSASTDRKRKCLNFDHQA